MQDALDRRFKEHGWPSRRTGLPRMLDAIADDVRLRWQAAFRWAARGVVSGVLDEDEFSGVDPQSRRQAARGVLRDVEDLMAETEDSWIAYALSLVLRPVMLMLTAAGAVVALVYTGARIWHDWLAAHGDPAHRLAGVLADAQRTWTGAKPADRWLVALGVVGAGYALWRLLRATTVSLIGHTRFDFEEELAGLVRPLVRVELNKRLAVRFATTLAVTQAPGLAETVEPDRLVARGEFQRIQRLIRVLGATAIAVSGSRGVGKTTLLRHVAHPDYDAHPDYGADPDYGVAGDTLRLIVAAPVTYDPRDFLIHLYGELCAAVLNRVGTVPAWRRIGRLAAPIRSGIRAVVCALLLVVWFGPLAGLGRAVPADLYLVRLTNSFWVAALATVGLGMIFILVGRLNAEPLSELSAAIGARAATELRKLRYLQTSSSERAGSFGRAGLQLGAKAVRQLAERPITLPELVESYRRFATETVTWWRRGQTFGSGRLVIGIDEIDRISDAEDAERFLNGIKSIFGLPHCVYVVTVSEEALARFERRVVSIRAAVDSAFDEVLRLEPFTFRESVELLQRRAFGFPAAFVALCHSMSGGVPRDLVRAARSLLDLTAGGGDTDLATLTDALVASEVAMLKRGFLSRAAALDGQQGALNLLACLISGADPTLDCDPAPGGELAPEVARVRAEFASAWYFYLTVADFFRQLARHGRVRQLAHARSPVLRQVEELARIRGLLPVSAALARADLDAFRLRAGFDGAADRPLSSSRTRRSARARR
jgi:hypothetical protein